MPSPVLLSQKAEGSCGQELLGASQMERLGLFFGFYLIMAALVGEARLQFYHL